MNLQNILQENVKRPYRIHRKTDGVLYHYTKLTALYPIISTGVFWGTRSEFLNDASELKYIRTVVEEVTAPIRVYDTSYTFKEAVLERLNGIYFNTHHPSKCYILSLTDIADLITNWSFYSNFDGYNIGLDASEVHSILDNKYGKAYFSGYVIYDKNTQEKIIKEEFEQYLNICESGFCGSKADLTHVAESFMYRILIYSYFFKHPSFKQEEEYRIAFFSHDLPEEYKSAVKFRISNGAITPYIELDFKEKNSGKLPLKEVWIGPKNKMDNAFLGMEAFLSSLGYRIGDPEGVNIKKSVIPLRF